MAEAEPDAIKCPKCGGPMWVNETYVKCKVCGHPIWRTVAGKLLSEATMKKVISTGTTQVLKGFKSKAGKEFDAALKLDEEGRIAFDFEKTNEKRAEAQAAAGGSAAGGGAASSVAGQRSQPMNVDIAPAGSEEAPPPPTIDDLMRWM